MRITEYFRRALPGCDHAMARPALRYPRFFGAAPEKREKNSPYSGFSWMGNIWLVYSIFFIADPIQRHSTRHWVALAVVYPVFLAVYFSFYRVTARIYRNEAPSLSVKDRTAINQQLTVAFAMFVLGAGYIPYNNSASGILVYAAASLPFLLESVSLILVILSVGSVLISIEGYFLDLSMWSWLVGVFFSFIVAISNLAVARQKRADSKLRMAHEEIEHLAKVAERERIARDLHDVLGHTLSVIVLKSELAGRLIQRDPARMAREIADVEAIARKALAEVREAIGGYRSEGLIAEIERAHRTLEAAGVQLQCESKPPTLSPAEETVLALVLREAVTNIVRHAGASRCDLAFFDTEGHHSVVIRDDGRGGVLTEGNGLRGMRERIEALGGMFAFDAAEGTRLVIQLPIAQSLEFSTAQLGLGDPGSGSSLNAPSAIRQVPFPAALEIRKS